MLEALVLLAADRLDRRPLVVVSLAAMALTQLGAALAPGPWTLALAMAAWGTATGIATDGAQGALIAAAPEEAERTMARWGIFAELGDLAAPLLFAAAAALGLGWRAVLGVAAAVAALNAVAVALGPPLRAELTEEEKETPLLEGLRAGLADRSLLAWLGAAAACTLLDELFVAFGGLYLRHAGASGVMEGVDFVVYAGAGVAALVLAERLSARISALGLLLGASFGCVLAYLGWLHAAGGFAGIILLAAVGAFVAPMYPYVKAQAYGLARPGVIAALDRGFLPFEWLAPLVVAWVADHVGLEAALLLLLVQPVIVALVAGREALRARRDSGG